MKIPKEFIPFHPHSLKTENAIKRAKKDWANYTIELLEDIRDNDNLSNEEKNCINGTIYILKQKF
jgi:ribonucleotide reductase beta subunit family protein with ferritin-like domain